MLNIRHEFQQRQHMLFDEFELFHYFDADDVHVQLHFHDFYECFLLLSGHLSYQIDNAIFSIKPGDLLVIGPNHLHRPLHLDKSASYERYVLWLAPSYVRRLSSFDTDLSQCFNNSSRNAFRIHEARFGILLSKFEQLLDETSSHAFGGDVSCRALITELLVYINRLCLDPTHAMRRKPNRATKLIEAVMSYLDKHLDQQILLDDVASHVFLSKFHLSRTFKEQTGTTIHQMMIQKRMIRARNLMLEGIPFNRIAALCGFSDYSGFYKAFQAEYGISPSAYAERIELL